MKRSLFIKIHSEGNAGTWRTKSSAGLSYALILFGYLFSVNMTREFCLGDQIIESMGLAAWSSQTGLHVSVFYGVGFMIWGWLLARWTMKPYHPQLFKSIPYVILFLLLAGPFIFRMAF